MNGVEGVARLVFVGQGVDTPGASVFTNTVVCIAMQGVFTPSAS